MAIVFITPVFTYWKPHHGHTIAYLLPTLDDLEGSNVGQSHFNGL